MARVLFGVRGGSQDYFPAPVPYRDVTLPEKLRFGYYLNGASVRTLGRAKTDLCIVQNKMEQSRALLLVTGPYWKQRRHFARQDMSALRSSPRTVRAGAALHLSAKLKSGFSGTGTATIHWDHFC
jgi:hypothetical protein